MNLHYNSSVGSGVELQSTESDQKVILMNFRPPKKGIKKSKQTNKGNKSGDFLYCPISRG